MLGMLVYEESIEIGCANCGHWFNTHLERGEGRCTAPECECETFIEGEDAD